MIRTGAGAATVLLVVATAAAPASADGDAEPEATDRYLAIPEAGAAMWFPPSWRLWQLEGATAFLVRAFDTATGDSCRVAASDAATAEAASRYGEGRAPGRTLLLERATFEAPAGPAVYEVWRFDTEPPIRPSHEYFVPTASGVVSVECRGSVVHGPPDDRWRSIIDTIGPMPADAPGGPPFDPRVVVADLGVAIELPAAWNVERYDEVGAMFGSPEALTATRYDLPDGTRHCDLEVTVFDPIAFGWPDRLAAGLLELADAEAAETGQPGLVIEVVELAGRDAIRIGSKDPQDMSIVWLVADSANIAALGCNGATAPDDRWRSIAATIEFLPPA